jgi:hypothetical protein
MNSKGSGRVRSLPNRDATKNFRRRTGENHVKHHSGQAMSESKLELNIFRIETKSSLIDADLVSCCEIRHAMEFGGFTLSVKHK